MLPNFVIVGTQKAGTTFIHKCLKEHPDIYIPKGEVSFFENPDYNKNTTDYLESLFRKHQDNKVLGIKRPSYLACKDCPKRIKKEIPHAKLIIILRNPVDRAISAYFHYMKTGFIPILPLEEGMLNIITGKYKERYPRSEEILRFGYYYEQLNHYLHYFNKKQILIELYDELLKNPLRTIQNIYEFLGVDNSFTPKSLKSHPQSAIYSLTRLKIINLMNAHYYSYNKKRTRLFLKKMNILDLFVIGLTVLADKLLSILSSNQKPQITKELRRTIMNIYINDINKLENLIKTDLNQWKTIK